MATLILLRHGRTSANTSGVLAGWTPGIGLDDTGRTQAEAVGRRLRGLPLAAIVRSPLQRCQETLDIALAEAARPAAAGLTPAATGAPPVTTAAANGRRRRAPKPPVPPVLPEPVVDERLGECRYGDWEGQPLKKLVKEPMWSVVQAHPSAAVFPNGEALAATAARGVGAVRDWDARVTAGHGPDALWLACSHGDVIKAIVADALGLHLDQFQRIVAEPCSITVIRYTPLRPFVTRTNDTGGDLSGLVPPKKARRRRATASDSDAAVGGGTGGSTTDASHAGNGTRRATATEAG
jgi:probable phosphomutase (TIGR03848 family)